MPYAATTKVPQSQTRQDIEKLLMRAGATAFAYGFEGKSAMISFKMRERHIRFVLPLPDTGEQALRSRWRALFLVIKAKVEAVESKIVTFDDEFLAHTVTPNGRTVSEWLQPQLSIAYQRGEMPPLLPGPKP